jgi:hypothetical protein
MKIGNCCVGDTGRHTIPSPCRGFTVHQGNKTALAMIVELAERSWRRLDGHNQLPKSFPAPNDPARHP